MSTPIYGTITGDHPEVNQLRIKATSNGRLDPYPKSSSDLSPVAV